MCDPVSLTIAAAAAMAGGTIYQGVQTRNAAKATASQYEEQGRQAAQGNLIQENRQRNETNELLATQRASFAEYGLDINSGTPLFLSALTAGRSEYDNSLMRLSGIRQVNTLNTQAKQTRKAGQDALIGSFLTAGGQALQAGASLGGGSGGGSGGKTGGASGGSSNTPMKLNTGNSSSFGTSGSW